MHAFGLAHQATLDADGPFCQQCIKFSNILSTRHICCKQSRDRCNTYLQSAIQIIGEILCRHSTHISVNKTLLSEWKINV